MCLDIDSDPTNRDWLRIVARMRRLRERRPELSDVEAFRRAVRAHQEYLRRGSRTG